MLVLGLTMRKESSHWYLGDVRGITNAVIYGMPVYSGSCLQRHWQAISIYLVIGLVLMVDSGSKVLS